MPTSKLKVSCWKYFSNSSFFSADRKNVLNGNEAIFSILVEELNFLSTEGIEICVDGKLQKICFALSLLAGDNEGLNSIMGFVEGFNASHYCRLCTMNKTDAHKNKPVIDGMHRTESNYLNGGFNNLKSTGVKEAYGMMFYISMLYRILLLT